MPRNPVHTDPATGETPRYPGRVALPGEAGSVKPPQAEPAGKTSPPPPSSVAESAAAAGTARTASPDGGRAGAATSVNGPEVAARTTAGSEPSESSSLPAETAGLSGAEWRKRAKAATSAQHAETRRTGTRYVPVARRTAYRPGMAVRKPQKPGDATP